MDISFWIKHNPKITVEHTTKKYFNRYLYRLVVYAPAGRLIDVSGPTSDMDKLLATRIAINKHINPGGWWGIQKQPGKYINTANTKLLTVLRDIRLHSVNFKLRIEEPFIQIYAESESDLQSLITTHTNVFKENILTITGPENSATKEMLNAGAIIRKSDIGFKYKVILRDGRYSLSSKTDLLNYITNLGPDIIRIPRSSVRMLSKGTSSIWGCYFYTNDLSINTFLTLICPGVILKTHELVILAHK